MADAMITRGQDPNRRTAEEAAVLLQPDFVGRDLLHFRSDRVPHRDLVLREIEQPCIERVRPHAFRKPAEELLRAHPRRASRRRG